MGIKLSKETERKCRKICRKLKRDLEKGGIMSKEKIYKEGDVICKLSKDETDAWKGLNITKEGLKNMILCASAQLEKNTTDLNKRFGEKHKDLISDFRKKGFYVKIVISEEKLGKIVITKTP